MFLNTLKVPYYNRMIGNSNKDFSNIVSVGEMIKVGVKQGKIETSEAKKLIPKRKEGETHTMSYQGKSYNPCYPHQQNYGYQPYIQYGGNAVQANYQSSSRPVVRFLALPPPAQMVTTQPMGQSGNNIENSRGVKPLPEQPQFDLIP